MHTPRVRQQNYFSVDFQDCFFSIKVRIEFYSVTIQKAESESVKKEKIFTPYLFRTILLPHACIIVKWAGPGGLEGPKYV